MSIYWLKARYKFMSGMVKFMKKYMTVGEILPKVTSILACIHDRKCKIETNSRK